MSSTLTLKRSFKRSIASSISLKSFKDIFLMLEGYTLRIRMILMIIPIFGFINSNLWLNTGKASILSWPSRMPPAKIWTMRQYKRTQQTWIPFKPKLTNKHQEAIYIFLIMLSTKLILWFLDRMILSCSTPWTKCSIRWELRKYLLSTIKPNSLRENCYIDQMTCMIKAPIK